LDGTFIVGGCPASERDSYAGSEALLLEEVAPAAYAAAVRPQPPGEIDSDNDPSTPDSLHLMGRPDADAVTIPASLDPFELLAEMHAEPAVATVPPVVPKEAQRPATPSLLRLPGWVRGVRRQSEPQPALSDAALADQLTRRGATIVAVGSRKGGVGKTSHAAGMAIVAGSLLDRVGHRAAILDANVANPDAWGQLSLPDGAATVRDLVNALADNREPPAPVFASTPALACYPESREGSEYTRTDVVRAAQWLRGEYTFIVIDLSNRLPDPLAGPEAAVAAFWLGQADCLVLPTAPSKQDFNGCLDYLELADLPPTIVAYLAPASRRNREHPLTKRYLAAISQRAASIVSLPDDAERVRYAGMQGVPVQDVSPPLRNAYRALVQAVASVRGS
jgi:cellulose biosynthesis protein BcsQ